MRLLFLVLFMPVSANAGWLKEFCERHLVGDAEIYQSIDLTELWVKSRNNNLIYMDLLEVRYEEIARELLWKRGQEHVLVYRLQKIGAELRRVDPGSPALEHYKKLEEIH